MGVRGWVITLVALGLILIAPASMDASGLFGDERVAQAQGSSPCGPCPGGDAAGCEREIQRLQAEPFPEREAIERMQRHRSRCVSWEREEAERRRAERRRAEDAAERRRAAEEAERRRAEELERRRAAEETALRASIRREAVRALLAPSDASGQLLVFPVVFEGDALDAVDRGRLGYALNGAVLEVAPSAEQVIDLACRNAACVQELGRLRSIQAGAILHVVVNGDVFDFDFRVYGAGTGEVLVHERGNCSFCPVREAAEMLERLARSAAETVWPLPSATSAIDAEQLVVGDMVHVRAGSFVMGSPEGEEGRNAQREAQVAVTLTRDFYLGRTPVTQGQWQAVMGESWFPSQFARCGTDCPVDSVSWLDAVQFANRVSEVLGFPPCYDAQGHVVGGATVYDCEGYRLPTEAEWEYAARAGTSGARYGEVDAIAWHIGNSNHQTNPVGEKQANAWGLHDMLGNVSEWTDTRYRALLSGGLDPVGPTRGSARTLRGGSWGSQAQGVRSANRASLAFQLVSAQTGFRLARTAP